MVVLCFLLLTCHLELSMENRSDWVSSISFNSAQELDPLKYLMRGGRRKWEGTSIKKENFQQKRQGDTAEMQTEAGSAFVAACGWWQWWSPGARVCRCSGPEKEGSGTTCLTKVK